jgi:hypothetical protein
MGRVLAALDRAGGAVHRVGFEIPPFEPLAESGIGPPAELAMHRIRAFIIFAFEMLKPENQ